MNKAIQWRIGKAGKEVAIYDNKGSHIATLPNMLSHGEIVANAKLIAAAPELLKECQRAQDELASAIKDGVSHFSPQMLYSWFNGVTSAIEKAKGE